MGTQGVVSVIENDQVVMKIIVGCNGDKASDVAFVVEDHWPISMEEAYEIAQECGFYDRESLVVMTKNETKYLGDHDLDPRYRTTFNQPEFNPRWDQGTADYVEVVKV